MLATPAECCLLGAAEALRALVPSLAIETFAMMITGLGVRDLVRLRIELESLRDSPTLRTKQ
jgi:hypothetical protein